MAQYDDLHKGTITLVGIVSAILTFVIIVAAQVLYFQYQDLETQWKEIDAPLSQSDNILDGQRAILNGYTWLDQEAGVISLPIDQSKSQVLSELAPAPQAPNP